MPCIENWNSSPLNIVQNIFENRNNEMNWIKQVTDYFDDRLKTFSNLKIVPSLNDVSLHNLRSGMLVRFRCMIQETQEPEYFMEKYEIKSKDQNLMACSGAFKDVVDIPDGYDISTATSTMGSRHVLYCVSIPGESSWVKEKFQSRHPSSGAANHVGDQQSMASVKRSLENDCDDAMEEEQPMTNGIDHSKRQKKAPHSNAENSSPLKKNHPLPDEDGAVCIVKVYDEDKEFKINEVYEFVGVLSMDASLEYVPDSNDHEMAIAAENRAHHPPPSFAPRLHCVHMRNLNHNNPLLFENTALDLSRLNVKEELIRFLKHATFGDELAAEYLLMHLTSRVYSRTGTLPVGKFSLNISNVSPNTKYPTFLSHLLKQILTKAFFFSMSLENLNKLTFIPSKNYTTNKLDSGILQLSDGTHIIIDETVLKPGQLDVNGVKHVQAFSNLLNFQKVEYNFQFHPLSFNHDVPVLVLSEGKSLLPCDCQVPLNGTFPSTPEDLQKHFEALNPAADFLDKFRAYLTLAKQAEYELGEDMMKVIENDFVAARQSATDKMTPDDLHMHLIVARLFSINSAANNLDMETWRKVGLLESSRRSRIALQ